MQLEHPKQETIVMWPWMIVLYQMKYNSLVFVDGLLTEDQRKKDDEHEFWYRLFQRPTG